MKNVTPADQARQTDAQYEAGLADQALLKLKEFEYYMGLLRDHAASVKNYPRSATVNSALKRALSCDLYGYLEKISKQ